MAVVGEAGEIEPGVMKTVEVDGEPVTIANIGGTFYAFSDSCTHRGCSLGEGEIEGTVVTCDCHGGQFDVTNGSVVEGPPDEDLPTYAVLVNGEDLEIG